MTAKTYDIYIYFYYMGLTTLLYKSRHVVIIQSLNTDISLISNWVLRIRRIFATNEASPYILVGCKNIFWSYFSRISSNDVRGKPSVRTFPSFDVDDDSNSSDSTYRTFAAYGSSTTTKISAL